MSVHANTNVKALASAATSPRTIITKALHRHRSVMGYFNLVSAFQRDPGRAARLSLSVGSMHLDYSKHLVDDETMGLLFDLARMSGVTARRDAMMQNQPINETEGRSVMHMALREPAPRPADRETCPIRADVFATRDRVFHFAENVRWGRLRSSTGRAFTDVVNIGIGGSDLGPAMVERALSCFADGPKIHFISNVDGGPIIELLRGLDPQTTLVIVSSKSFSTPETMANARTVLRWLEDTLGDRGARAQMCGVTANVEAATAFGIADDRIFPVWDSVGGRYSLWSAIGLPVILSIGAKRFDELLAGAHAMDEHFRTAPVERSMPVVLAMLSVWYRNFWDAQSAAVMAYEQRLELLPSFLQQLAMESNGKSVRLDGTGVEFDTAPVIWGGVGTNGQHAFFQMLHQGTTLVPCDFLVAAEAHQSIADHHKILLANCFAQSRALMCGVTESEAAQDLTKSGMASDGARNLAAHKAMPGNRPSSTIVYRRLDPYTLGMLIALYEHKTFVEGCVWGINSFDQWGVELGKKMASILEDCLEGGKIPANVDSSTRLLVEIVRHINDSVRDGHKGSSDAAPASTGIGAEATEKRRAAPAYALWNGA